MAVCRGGQQSAPLHEACIGSFCYQCKVGRKSGVKGYLRDLCCWSLSRGWQRCSPSLVKPTPMQRHRQKQHSVPPLLCRPALLQLADHGNPLLPLSGLSCSPVWCNILCVIYLCHVVVCVMSLSKLVGTSVQLARQQKFSKILDMTGFESCLNETSNPVFCTTSPSLFPTRA